MKALTADQAAAYQRDGYLLLPGFIPAQWIDRLNQVVERFVDESRELTDSTRRILVEPSHRPDAPRLRRIPHPVALDPVFEEFGLRGPLLDLAEDLLGPDVRFHHSKLNFKWAGGGEEVKWHQDIQFWPHTNYSPLTIGVYLDDVDDSMGPMGIIAGSHKETLYSLHDETDRWTGSINDHDLQSVALDRVAWLTGPKGSVTIHNCRCVHGSAPNNSARMRPLLLHTYAAADALPITRMMDGVPHSNALVRGNPATHARFDPDPCPLPPDFKKGEYKSIFSEQQGEGRHRA